MSHSCHLQGRGLSPQKKRHTVANNRATFLLTETAELFFGVPRPLPRKTLMIYLLVLLINLVPVTPASLYLSPLRLMGQKDFLANPH